MIENSTEKSEEKILEKKNPSYRNQEDINDFSVGGKIVFDDFRINLYSKYILNHDQKTNILIPSSLTTFSHQVSPWMKYSLKHYKGSLRLCTSMSSFSNFLLSSKIDIDNIENPASTPIDVIAKYNLKNNLVLQLGIKDYDLIKAKMPTNFCAGISKPFNFLGNNKLNTSIFMNYSLYEKFLKNCNFCLGINNSYLKTVLNCNYNKKSKSSQSEKELKMNGEIKVSNKMIMGTEINYFSSDHGAKIKLFTKYIIDQFTDFMGKWDDKDKSIMLKMNHDFRGLFKLGIEGKFTPVEENKKECKLFKIPSFKVKTGILIDISEQFI